MGLNQVTSVMVIDKYIKHTVHCTVTILVMSLIQLQILIRSVAWNDTMMIEIIGQKLKYQTHFPALAQYSNYD